MTRTRFPLTILLFRSHSRYWTREPGGHQRDVMGLFGKVGDTLPNPVSNIQEESAERGK